MTEREARLRPEFAAEYPGITPNLWMRARELAQSLVDRVHARRKQGLYTRTFDPTHFDFRGGDSAPRTPRDRSRSTDGFSAAPLSAPPTSVERAGPR